MLPEEKREAVNSHIMSKPSFTVEYRLDARNLCADFKEDIAFKFSFSPANLISKYLRRPVSITAFWNQPPVQVGLARCQDCYIVCSVFGFETIFVHFILFNVDEAVISKFVFLFVL